jgi:hypothetical protein
MLANKCITLMAYMSNKEEEEGELHLTVACHLTGIMITSRMVVHGGVIQDHGTYPNSVALGK